MITSRSLMLGVLMTGVLAGSSAAQTTPQVTVTRSAGRIVAEVRSGPVTIRKEVTPVATVAVIATANDALTIRTSRGRLEVSRNGATSELTTGEAAQVTSVLALLSDSEAARAGRELLETLGPSGADVGRHILLLTRAVLELGEGESDAIRSHQEWMRSQADLMRRRQAEKGGVTRVSLQSGGSDRGPGECWDEYAKEAIRIYDDYVDCLSQYRWYHVFNTTGCALVYTVRAEAAMWWFINCSGGFPFSG